MDEQKELIQNSPSSQTQSEPVPDIEIPTLRTYKSDINQTVNKDKITTAKILIAEQNRQNIAKEKDSETSIKRPTNILVLILSILLLVAAIGVIGYFGYTKVVKQTFTPVQVPSSFLFIFDTEKFVDVSKDKLQIYSDVEKNIQEVLSMKNQTYADIIFYKTNTTTKEKSRITSAEFLNIYNISLPTNIARSISKDFVYGAYKNNDKVEPFLVVGLSDYETFYSSVFIWESTMALDLKDLFPNLRNLFDLTKNKNTIQNLSTVSTTTQSTSTLNVLKNGTSSSPVSSTTIQLTPEQEIQKQVEDRNVINRTIRFVDTVFSNKDARVVRDSNGTPFFYYAFIDRNKILFAQDPTLLNEISRKIKEKSLVR